MDAAAPDRGVAAIAARLQSARRALGYNQRELCALTEIATNTYNQWERGRGRPELDEAIKLRKIGLTLDWIYLGDPAGLPHSLALKLAAEASPDPSQARRATAQGGR